MRPAEIFLRSGREGVKENNGRVNLIKIYCKHICKCHNATLCTTNYMLVKINKKACFSITYIFDSFLGEGVRKR
jgi:hypothetical protein